MATKHESTTQHAHVYLDRPQAAGKELPIPTLTSIQQVLKHPLDRIPRSTWHQLGAECHNKGLSSEIVMATPAGSMTLPSGIPRIIVVIQRQRTLAVDHILQPQTIPVDDIPLLWYLYASLNQRTEHVTNHAINTKQKRKTLSDDTNMDSNQQQQQQQQQPWQLQLLKSSCPEIFVLTFLEAFQKHGRLFGFEREMPRTLMEAIDFELGYHSEYSKKAVYALMQTLIACRRYLKNIATKHLQPEKEEEEYHKMAVDLDEAFVAMEIFLDGEATLPKLTSLMEQEVATDVKANTRIGATVKKYGTTPSSTPSLGSGSTTMKDNPSPTPGTLRTTVPLIEQAQSRAANASTAASANTSSLSTTAQNAKIKVSNPLWSQTLGQNYMPQWPAKYVNQIDVELRRWFSLIAHVNGAAFAENLTALIKAVYPSDQKFLLDLILIEYMCLEVMSSAGTDQADRESDATVFSATDLDLTNNSARSKTPGEKVVETIMSALVSLVIKPEDSLTYLEPGSKRWAEAMDPSALETQEDELGLNKGSTLSLWSSSSSIPTVAAAKPAALGGSKIKKRRNLYNRRVSPFYAILAMFTPKRTAGRVQGVLYLSPEEMETKDGPTTEDTTMQEGLLLLGLESALPVVVEDENPDPIIQHKKLKRAHKKKIRQQNQGQGQQQQQQQQQGPGQGPGQRRMSAGGSNAGGGGKRDGHAFNKGPRHVQGLAKTSATTQQQQSPTVAQHYQLETTQAEDEKEEIELDTDELLRAKEAETKRMACQAPFRVLMLILQSLTRVNQAGALDNWIADALSGTVQPLQIQYFQWLLRSLVMGSLLGQSETIPFANASTAAYPSNTTSTPSAATASHGVKMEGDMEVDGQLPTHLPSQLARTRDTGEIQRLLLILVGTAGIGYDPLRTAYTRFRFSQVNVVGGQVCIDRLVMVEEMLDKHFSSLATTATTAITTSAMEVETKPAVTNANGIAPFPDT